MTEQIAEFNNYAVKSYRYLRLAIVAMVVVLGASVAIEMVGAECLQGSISAYYYTPAHSAFVGALVAIGVCLIAVKGRYPSEDMLLNVAGMLAPIVAFVPTGRSEALCVPKGYLELDTDAFVDNNIRALAIGGVVVLIAATSIALRGRGKKATAKQLVAGTSPPVRYGLAIMGLLIAAGWVWYAADRSGFRTNAHSGAAIAMFVAIGLVVIINGRKATKGVYRWIYGLVAVCMIVGAAGVLVGRFLINKDWTQTVLWLEIVEIVPFAVFWTAQTVEHWDAGINAPVAASPPT